MENLIADTLRKPYYDYTNMTTLISTLTMPAGEFKSKCLKIMDNVNATHEEVIITKHGKPVAKLVPYTDQPSKTLFGFMPNAVSVHGDIVAPLDIAWEADSPAK